MSMSRFRSDALWSALGTLLPMAIGVAAVPILLRTLDSSIFAIYLLGLAIISLCPNLDFGVSRAAFRHVAAEVGGDIRVIQGWAAHAMRRSLWVGVVVSLCLGVLLGGVAVLGVLPDKMVKQAWLAIAVTLMGVTPAIMANTQRAILEGARLFSSSATARVALGIASAIAPIALSLFTKNVVWLCAVAVLFRVIILWHQHRVLLREFLLAPDWKDTQDPDEKSSGFLAESRWYALQAPLALLMSGYDKIIVLILSGLGIEQLAGFIIPQEIALKVVILPAAIIPAVMVRLASERGSEVNARRLVEPLFYRMSGVVFIYCAVGSFFARLLVDLFFHALDPQVVVPVVNILVLGIFSSAISQFPMAGLTARGWIRPPTLMQAVEFPLFVVALYITLARLGVIGAAWVWSLRIIFDTFGLLILARRHVPHLAIRYAHAVHLGGLLLLGGLLV
jgi:O-antigen/teichoic acid export membrane protein